MNRVSALYTVEVHANLLERKLSRSPMINENEFGFTLYRHQSEVRRRGQSVCTLMLFSSVDSSTAVKVEDAIEDGREESELITEENEFGFTYRTMKDLKEEVIMPTHSNSTFIVFIDCSECRRCNRRRAQGL